MTNENNLPSAAKKIADEYPELWTAFTAFGKASSESGPIDAKTARLVKVALAIGAGLEGAVHSHVRRALAEGVPAEELNRHSPDDIQIHGNRTTAPSPRELCSHCSHPMT